MKQLIKSPEAAKLLAVSPRTLHSLTHAGGLPFVRIGRCLRYDLAELTKWIAAKSSPALSSELKSD